MECVGFASTALQSQPHKKQRRSNSNSTSCQFATRAASSLLRLSHSPGIYPLRTNQALRASPSHRTMAAAAEDGRAATKYVLITGGVVSGLGKGVTASSVGVVLKSCGLRVTCIKIDPYLNTDAGTMSPFEHGEVFVLDDGGEVDLDLGNYERFLDVTLTRENNITTGKIYQSVIEKERKGDYLGKTVQVVPHVTDEIKNWIQSVSAVPVDGQTRPADVCVIELGGTVGDIESMPFIEALRQLSFSLGTLG